LRAQDKVGLANFVLSEAIQKAASEDWIASSQGLLAMTKEADVDWRSTPPLPRIHDDRRLTTP
jgi:hypothetical protein